MEEIEVPIEQVHESIHHHAHHSEDRWVTWVALSTALLAGLAAIAALLSGYHANTAVIDRVDSSDKWNFYQAKSTKSLLLHMKVDLLIAMEKTVSAGDKKKLEQYEQDKTTIKAEAEELVGRSKEHFERHEMLARSVTLFQVAIAVAAIAVLTKLPWFWYLGLAFGVGATGFLIWGIIFTPKEEAKDSEAALRRAAVRCVCYDDMAHRVPIV